MKGTEVWITQNEPKDPANILFNRLAWLKDRGKRFLETSSNTCDLSQHTEQETNNIFIHCVTEVQV